MNFVALEAHSTIVGARALTRAHELVSEATCNTHHAGTAEIVHPPTEELHWWLVGNGELIPQSLLFRAENNST
jgi:hypothetical protein